MKNRLPKIIAAAVLIGLVTFGALFFPRTWDLGNGYAYVHFPAGGHRYLVVQPEGIKKVGQEVLEYRVTGNVITGRVRLALGGTDIRAFTLNTTSHIVTLFPPLEPLDSSAPPE